MKIKLQDISIWLFMVFSMVYFIAPIEYECEIPKDVILWGSAFYVFIYGLIVALLIYILYDCYGIRRLYYIFSVIYFSVLALINIICFIKPTLFGPLISKAESVIIPFIVIIAVTGMINVYIFVKKRKKP
jgi:hypothetical protein